jgi:DNA-3-methyladenine glycosylase II
MKYFPYSDFDTEYLKSKDKTLGEMIEKIGFVNREVNTNLFESLVESIVSQQVSTTAAATVFGRLVNKVITITPENIINLGINGIASCGMSMRKASYIYDSTMKIIVGEVNLNELENLTDEEVIKELTKLRGIGKWTAEMFLIFSMLRKDVLSYDDLAIQRGMRMLYQIEDIDKSTFGYYRDLYSPCGSIASIYLWSISTGKYGHIDPKIKK